MVINPYVYTNRWDKLTYQQPFPCPCRGWSSVDNFGKYSPQYTLWRKTLGEEGGGEVVKVETGNWELRIRSCRMSIMAFELPIMEMAFALSEFEFKVFTLEIDFQFRIVTFGNRFSNLSSHF